MNGTYIYFIDKKSMLDFMYVHFAKFAKFDET